MLPEPSTPLPKPIDRVSPTLANDLLACSRRVAFSRDAAYRKWRRPSTFSVLGDAAHSVAELVAKRSDWPVDSTDRRTELEGAWDDRINAGATRLAEAWSPAEPPPPAEWPSFQLTRSRTLRRADRAIAARQVEPVGERVRGERGSGRVMGVEVELQDNASRLYGRADRVDRVDGSYRVVDLKTGMHQDEPKKEQLRQLLLYAVLVHRTSGEWPSEIAIENASGEQFVLPLDRGEAEGALAEVVKAVASFNAQSSSGSGAFAASPDADTCRWCPYRTSCDEYWRDLRADWGHASVFGLILGSGADAKGGHADIEVVAPNDLGVTTTHLMNLSEAPPSGATWLAVVDLQPLRDPSSVGARWSSRIATWRSRGTRDWRPHVRQRELAPSPDGPSGA